MAISTHVSPRIAAILLMTVCAPSPAVFAGPPAAASPAFHVMIANPVVRWRVEQALDGAARRLAGSECQKLFTEFEDGAGQSLRARLETLHQTGEAFLEMLRFADGETMPLCARTTNIAAFTQPGSRVVQICGAVFARQSARNPQAAEVLMIHELLHTLGLEENPPSASEISRRVLVRCGAQKVQRKPI